ncbi:MAG: hypothetical protein GX442_11695 [Candidatus Riflebacteria bacterium]|nr:hypothetical protein [Candidatus Riflebacteria bacterium]
MTSASPPDGGRTAGGRPAGRRPAPRALLLTFLLVVTMAGTGGWHLSSTAAFDDRDITLINVVLPMIRAGIRARRHHRKVAPAVLQAALGGLMMREAMARAERAEDKSAFKAWRAKLMMNVGASLAESAGGDLEFRMDLGPLWLVTRDGRLDWRIGLHGTIAPLLNMTDGARVSWPQTFKYGTLAFKRGRNTDGTIGTRGALAYSNANNFITNDDGSHAGHELIHTFQYRRDAFLSPRLTRLWPALEEHLENHLGHRWLDDTGWGVNWAAQCTWARLTGHDRDFEIPLEKEAYYLADNIEF